MIAEFVLRKAQMARRIDAVLYLRDHREMPGDEELVVKPPAESGGGDIGRREESRHPHPAEIARAGCLGGGNARKRIKP